MTNADEWLYVAIGITLSMSSFLIGHFKLIKKASKRLTFYKNLGKDFFNCNVLWLYLLTNSSIGPPIYFLTDIGNELYQSLPEGYSKQ
ncbi:MAG TPA: hypothetical protein EYH13_04285 [Thermococcus paralvinellae]|uniref:Uncharacterized protein n=1 Tax=Thermococcus paralvinellae TaxID=582419 RepID=A0A833E125_9EURY|nr:hypothetical protein [Thermococcus paralvinellae]